MSIMSMRKDETKPNQNPGYMGPDNGPFECENCEHYEPDNQCKKPEMIKFYGSSSDSPYAEVDPEGCCNYFKTNENRSQDDNNDEEDDYDAEDDD